MQRLLFAIVILGTRNKSDHLNFFFFLHCCLRNRFASREKECIFEFKNESVLVIVEMTLLPQYLLQKLHV